MNVYVHIPFCEQRCYYCAFTVAVTPDTSYEPYVRRLLLELELSGLRDEPQAVYFGGGTPSIVPASMLERVLQRIGGNPVEITVEVNPGTLSANKLAEYRAMGISRISLGAQSLEDEDLQRAGRLHRSAAVIEDFEALRRWGFANINLDLIAGLPDQRLETWTRNLDRVLELHPEHISLYMLDVEEHSAWGRHAPEHPGEENAALFYTEAELRLERAGYQHYEISNWALPGFECRQNLGYWTGVPYRGFGVAAHSFDGKRRYWNTASLVEYAERLDAGQLPTAGEEVLTGSLQMEETFLLGLRRTAGFDVLRAARQLDLKIQPDWFVRVEQLREAGLVEFDGAILKLTSAGRLLASTVTEELLWPTPSSTFGATQ